MRMRIRIGSAVAVIAAAVGLTSGIAGPIYSAFGGQSDSSSTSAQASTSAQVSTPGQASTQGQASTSGQGALRVSIMARIM
jgi:hypothetical protein